MAQILHQSKIIQRRETTITTTTCNRMSNKDPDGWNVADTDDQVTCKFCLKIMNRKK